MSFISFEFLLFAPLVLTAYFIIPYKYRWAFVLLCSYFFYGYHNPSYIVLLLISTFIDYYAGRNIYSVSSKKQKKKWLRFSIFSNISILFFFKYFNFFRNEITDLFLVFGLQLNLPEHNLLLPLGISFYTFQTISYTVDIYRGYLKPEPHFGKFALYVCFFPQLVAGPIEKAKNLLTQFHFKFDFDYLRVKEGLQLILWGVFKKLVVADRIAPYVQDIYLISNQHQGPIIIFGTFLFALQLFYDFSAYCDIAIGLARIMGVKLSRNFPNHIYFVSPSALWKEWHITLTEWFRDYVFIPLLKLNNRKWFWYFSLFLTFILTGVWHGANWTFLVWGGLHGVFLVVDHLTKKYRLKKFKALGISTHSFMFKICAIIFTYILFLFSAVFFRAETVSQAFLLLNNAFDWSKRYYLTSSVNYFDFKSMMVIVLFAESLAFLLGNKVFYDFVNEKIIILRWLIYAFLINMILYLRAPEIPEFIYFEF